MYKSRTAPIHMVHSPTGTVQIARRKCLEAGAACQAALEAPTSREPSVTFSIALKNELDETCAKFDACYGTKSKLCADLLVQGSVMK